MAQEKLKFNNTVIRQPDAGLAYDFETTYSEGSGRETSGILHEEALFTVERFGYEASRLTLEEMSQILQIIAKGARFTMHYLSPYYGEWRDDTFYVGKGSLAIGTWHEDTELYDSLSFNIVGVNPL